MQTVKLDNHELPYAVKEEMKMLRTNLMFCGEDKKVILMTSVVSDEGKSECSINLCRSLAELGQTVLLVDADLRKSVLIRRAEDSNAKLGIAHFLAGQCSADDILYWSGMENFYYIPAGAFPPNPSELLASKRMAQFIEVARSQFDYIIIDAPPLGMVVDAATIAPYCDGSLLLLESGRSPYRAAQNVVENLRNTGCPILGVVLNKVGLHKNGAYGRYYSAYYGKYYGGYYRKYQEEYK